MLERRAGFEPIYTDFAGRSLWPLGYPRLCLSSVMRAHDVPLAVLADTRRAKLPGSDVTDVVLFVERVNALDTLALIRGLDSRFSFFVQASVFVARPEHFDFRCLAGVDDVVLNVIEKVDHPFDSIGHGLVARIHADKSCLLPAEQNQVEVFQRDRDLHGSRSEEHTSELQSLR